jgi:hypothetical protein
MNLVVIVREGPDLNLTLSSIQFDKYGAPTHANIHVCNEWIQGFEYAKRDFSHALFVDSGTVFTDWNQWLQLLEQYPHRGIIAHIIAHPGQPIYLDQQCWFLDLSIFDVSDFAHVDRVFLEPIVSEKNLHNDYTPLWIKSGKQYISEQHNKFGQGLIARQLNLNLPVVNWNNTARTIKHFVYPQQGRSEIDHVFADYNAVAEQQLWIVNNEQVVQENVQRLCTPGSGLYWMVNAVASSTNLITVVDISKTQLKFCEWLWNHWNGDNYGLVAWEFIKQHKVKHFQLDNPEWTTHDKLSLIAENKFVDHVNACFNQVIQRLGINDFSQHWLRAKDQVQLQLVNDNLITFVSNSTEKYNKVWCSNVLNYKWTLIHTTQQQYREFEDKIYETRNKPVNL